MSDQKASNQGSVKRLARGWIRPEIQALSAYHVPPSKGKIKLDAMENPFGWPQDMVDAWRETLACVELNRYPDPTGRSLVARFRELWQIDDRWSILLGNGSDEIIQLLAMAVAAPDRCIMAPEPSFVMYRMIATFVGMRYSGVPLDEQFDIDLPATLEAIEREQPALLFLALPNNPTGSLFSPDRVAAVIEACPGLVVLDEAYTPFTAADHLGWLSQYDNVVVMRTVSKMGLAGLRLGLLVGHPDWLNEFDKVRLPYNVNSLTQASAEFALSYNNELNNQTQLITELRADLLAGLRARFTAEQLFVWPSEANFVLVRVAGRDAKTVHQHMADNGVLVKCLDGSHPALANCLRLTVGAEDENQRMLAALEAALV